ncbi:MAG: hypothetical protein WBA93_01875 [Microcoleaceae cyanobacterium]
MTSLAFAGLAVESFSSAAEAVLLVNINGTAGSGQTTWVFSGSAVAGGSGFFEDDTELSSNDAWQNIGNYTTVNDLESPPISSNAILSINSITRDIDIPYIDNDSGVNADDFGVGVSGSEDFNFFAGDLVSWSGSLVAAIDINDLSESGIPVVFNTNNYGGEDNILDLEVRIGVPVASTPEPATILGLLTFSTVALASRYRRSK